MRLWLRLITGINSSFQVKLIVNLACIILFAFGITGYLTYRNNLDLFEQEISKQFSKTNEEALAKLELKVQEINRISQTIVFNPQIEKMIGRINESNNSDTPSDPFHIYFDKKQIEEQMLQIKLDVPNMTGLYLYDLNGNPSYFSYTTSSINHLDESLFRTIRSKINNSSGDMVWMNMAVPSSIEPSGYRNTIIVARFMKNNTLATYGMLVMAIDETFFSSSLKEITKDGLGQVYLFNQMQELLYTNTTPGTRKDLRVMNGLEETKVLDNHLYVQSASKTISFKLVSGTSLTEIRAKNREQLERILVSGLIIALVTSVPIMLSTGKLLRPLTDLLQGLRKVRSGDFDARIEVRTKDELAFIGDSFNAMTEQVGRLIKEVYLTQLSEREAELKALQAQLNPHFLHNMFNEIYWKLYLRNEEETAGLIAAISDMLKYSLMPVQTLTTVGEELQQIRNYVKIQQELFETDLETRIEADDDVLGCEMMRSILQPLVENVFMHAFRNKVSDKKLTIRARRKQETLEIVVEDNGCGMEAEAVARLLDFDGSALPQRKDGRESLGVRSVMRRIALLHGAPYRLEIQSTAGEGTGMRLILPYNSVGKDEPRAC